MVQKYVGYPDCNIWSPFESKLQRLVFGALRKSSFEFVSASMEPLVLLFTVYLPIFACWLPPPPKILP